MSVINNVLRDLQNRESRFTPIEIESVDLAAPAPSDSRSMMLAGLTLLALAAAGWIYLQDQLMRVETPVMPTPVTANVITVTEPVAAGEIAAVTEATVNREKSTPAAVPADRQAIVGAGNQIIGLQIRESEDEMRVEFVLRDKVIAYLKQRGENSFVYHLREIESRIDAPQISDNPWIRTLSIDQSQQGVDILFETAPDILVESRQNRVDGDLMWTINLRKAVQPATVVETAPPAKPVATEADAGQAQSAHGSGGETPTSTVAKPRETAAANQAQPVVRLDIRSTNPDADAINRLEYARELIDSRRYQDAEKLLRGLLDGSEDSRARRHLLALYRSRQNLDRFARLARDSVERYPDHALFRIEYARHLFQQASYRDVIRLLGGEADLDAIQQALIAASYQRVDEHDAAVRHYRLALTREPANARNWIGLAISQENTAALEEALRSYQRAGKLGGLSNRLRAFVDERSKGLRQVLN